MAIDINSIVSKHLLSIDESALPEEKTSQVEEESTSKISVDFSNIVESSDADDVDDTAAAAAAAADDTAQEAVQEPVQEAHEYFMSNDEVESIRGVLHAAVVVNSIDI